jgi:hypothetical protein
LRVRTTSPWFETRGVAALLTMRVGERPHPEERPFGRVSKEIRR